MSIDEEKVVTIIKDTLGDKEIKTNSHQIMARFEREKATSPTSKKWFSFPVLKIALPILISSVVIAVFMGTLGKSNPSSPTISEPDFNLSPMKTIEGKEDEFIFLSLTATAFAPSNDINMTNYRLKLFNKQTTYTQEELIGVLDQTMPLVTDFYEIDESFTYVKNQGTFEGVFGVYTHQFIIGDNVEIIANVDFEEDDDEVETEIEGEIIIEGTSYRYEGESEYDAEDNERDFSMKIEYSDDSYMELESENQGKHQTFKYKLVESDKEVFSTEIESFRRDNDGGRYTKVDVMVNKIDYKFIFNRIENIYYAEIKHQQVIIELINGDYKYTF